MKCKKIKKRNDVGTYFALKPIFSRDDTTYISYLTGVAVESLR